MRILIDGDATPDIEKIAFLCDKYDIKMIVYCDMNHFFDMNPLLCVIREMIVWIMLF